MLKIFTGFIMGVVIAVFAISLWRNEEVDWGQIITMGIGGLIGILIVAGIKNVITKVKEDN